MGPTPFSWLNRKVESTLSYERRIRKSIQSALLLVPVTLLVSNQLAGCAPVVEPVMSFMGAPSEPRRLSKQELSTYETVEEMIVKEFGTRSAVTFTASRPGKLLEPYENAKGYCELHGATLLRTRVFSGPKLSYRPQFENEMEWHRNFERRTAGVFGTFQCIRSDDPLWEISIGHNGNRVTDRNARDGLTTIWVDVRSKAVLVERDLREMERREQADAAAEAHRAEMVEQKRRAREFRANLKIGDKSQCGYVIGIRPPMVEVAVSSGSQWFRVENLVPAETPYSSCPDDDLRVVGDSRQGD